MGLCSCWIARGTESCRVPLSVSTDFFLVNLHTLLKPVTVSSVAPGSCGRWDASEEKHKAMSASVEDVRNRKTGDSQGLGLPLENS